LPTKARTIRLPVHMIELVNKTDSHLTATGPGIGPRTQVGRDCKRMDIPEAKVRRVFMIMQVPISLETPIGEVGDSHLSDLIEDRAVISPAATINKRGPEGTGRARAAPP